MAESLVDPNFLRFQQNLKRTAFGVKFGRALFTGGNGAMSVKFLREAFKELGLEIPEAVEITIDAAQVLVSGAAVVDAIETYETFDDVRGIARASTNTFAATQRLAEHFGWLKKDSDEAQIMRTASNVAMIIASGGLDVKAWLSLAMDFTSWEAMNAGRAKQIAYEGLMTAYRARVNPQAQAAASVLKQYQEKDISVFEFVGRMAEVAPDLWPQYFPQYASWAPVYQTGLISRSETVTWYGSGNSYAATHFWNTIAGYTPDQIRGFIFKYMVEPTLQPYRISNDVYEIQGKASLKTLAILSTMVGFTRIEKNVDYSILLSQNQLTLSDFKDPVILDYLYNLTDPASRERISSAVQVSGKAVLSETEAKNEAMRVFAFKNKQLLIEADRAGRIDIINKIPELRSRLKYAMSFPEIGIDQKADLEKIGTLSKADMDKFLKTPGTQSGSGAPWREIRNYFACLALLDQVRKDKYFKGFTRSWLTDGFEARDISSYDFMSTVDDFEATHRDVTMKSVLRKVNTLALGNVAFFLNTTPDKLVRLNRRDSENPAVYDKRG